VKIGDFGISKLIKSVAFSTIDEQRRSNSELAGTAHWMAPEVMAGALYGRKADIW